MAKRNGIVGLLGVLLMGLILSACGTKFQIAVQGRVWSDDNGNGIQDSGEEGIAGVPVRMEELADEDFPQLDTTDGDGNYEFRFSSEHPEWVVIVEPPDQRIFTHQNVGRDPDADKFDSDVDSAGKAAYDIGDENANPVIDAGLLRPGFTLEDLEQPEETGGDGDVPRMVSISGSVYDDLEGDGLYQDESLDKFLDDVEVQLIDAETGLVIDTTSTFNGGSYSFEPFVLENPVRINFVSPDAIYQFSPVGVGEAEQFPSSVDFTGLSQEIGAAFVQTIQPVGDFFPVVVNAGLTEKPEQTELVELYPIACTTGEDVEMPGYRGPEIPPIVDDEVIFWGVTFPEQPADTPFCIGLDFTSSEKTTLSANPDNVLIEGSLYSTSACVVNGTLAGIAAAQAGANGEAIPLSTAATAVLDGGLLVIAVSVEEIGSGVTGFRPVTSDLQTCIFRRPLSENNAFESSEAFGANFAQALASADGTRTCDPASNTCLMISDTLDWTRTGDQTADLTLDGVTYAVQFTTAAGEAQTRKDEFVTTGWALGDPTTSQTALRNWEIVPLEANSAVYGLLAVSENGSSDNPVGFAVSIISSAPVPDAALGTLSQVLDDLLGGFRSAFELVQ